MPLWALSHRPEARLAHLEQATLWFMQNAIAKPDNAGAGSYDYMHSSGCRAWLHVGANRQGCLAIKPAGNGDAAAMDAKLLLAKYFMERIMPESAPISPASPPVPRR